MRRSPARRVHLLVRRPRREAAPQRQRRRHRGRARDGRAARPGSDRPRLELRGLLPAGRPPPRPGLAGERSAWRVLQVQGRR